MRAQEQQAIQLRQNAVDAARQLEADLRAKDEQMQKKAMEDMLQVGAVQEELASVRAERDSLYDAKMKVEETVDDKDS